MSRNVLVWCSLLLLLLPGCHHRSQAQGSVPVLGAEWSNVLIAPLHTPGREAIVAIADAQRGVLWYHATAERQLDARVNPPETSLEHIDQISVSDDDRWLAVISVGEGHPVVDVFDLRAMVSVSSDAEPQALRAIASINPYPGSVRLDGWSDGVLRLGSDADLLRVHQHDGMQANDGASPEESIFFWRIADDTMTRQP